MNYFTLILILILLASTAVAVHAETSVVTEVSVSAHSQGSQGQSETSVQTKTVIDGKVIEDVQEHVRGQQVRLRKRIETLQTSPSQIQTQIEVDKVPVRPQAAHESKEAAEPIEQRQLQEQPQEQAIQQETPQAPVSVVREEEDFWDWLRHRIIRYQNYVYLLIAF